MTQFLEATSTEKVLGHPAIESALTVVGALAGGPLAPLLPILTKCIASERQRTRVEDFLREVSEILQSQEAKLNELQDSNFKLINECILAGLHTTEAEKLKLLREAVRSSLSLEGLEPVDAVLLSRALKEISADEAKFLITNYHFRFVVIAASPASSSTGEKTLTVKPGSKDETIVLGLSNLGLLFTGEVTLGQLLRFSSIAGKLVVLLKAPDNDLPPI